MVLRVASGQLAAVSPEGAESQAGWMLRVALPRLSGPRWAAWPGVQTILLLLDVSQIDYYFLMCSERMLNAANQQTNQPTNQPNF
jgi:hypothetical protein